MEHLIAHGRRVLVVEDEYLIALTIEELLKDLGVEVVGPASSLTAAMRLTQGTPIHAAILDVNIRGGTSYPVADVLAEKGIPFIFCSGYGDWAIEERHRTRPRLAKPYSAGTLEAMVLELLGLPDPGL